MIRPPPRSTPSPYTTLFGPPILPVPCVGHVGHLGQRLHPTRPTRWQSQPRTRATTTVPSSLSPARDTWDTWDSGCTRLAPRPGGLIRDLQAPGQHARILTLG